ncbi:hypothetical protein Gotur_006333, partial [Gossypium turneri]
MIEKGCAPDILSYNIMINGYCKSKRLDEAMELFHQIAQNGPIPDTVTYNTLMQAMQNSRLKLNVASYNILIDGLCKAGNIEVGKELFHKLSVNGLKPNVYTYAIMINGFCRDGLPDEAYQLFRSMEDNDCLPDSFCYNVMIQGFL